MWSLAGNEAVDPPIPQLCSWDKQAAAPAALAWDALKLLWALSAQLADGAAWAWATGAQAADSAALGLGHLPWD